MGRGTPGALVPPIGTIISGGSRISPRWGANPPGWGGVVHKYKILPNFPKKCMKLKEFSHPYPSLDPLLIIS